MLYLGIIVLKREQMEAINWQPLWLSLQLAIVTTIGLLIVGLPLAAYLAQSKSKFKFLLEALVGLPLVLPPTVLGFYLLVLWSRRGVVGGWLYENLGIELIFSFWGLVLGSMCYSLPFMVQPVQAGLQNLPTSLREAAYTMGKGHWQVFWRVLLPNIRPALLTGIVLSFAHTIGEFGVVLMIGGKIPGQTLVASVAVYDHVEALEYDQANFYSFLLLLLSFIILALTYGWRSTSKRTL